MNKFTTEYIEAKIKKRIQEKFGDQHTIKLVLFKPFRDIYGNYCEPLLILINSQFDDIIHNIPVWDLVPGEYDDKNINVDDLMFKF